MADGNRQAAHNHTKSSNHIQSHTFTHTHTRPPFPLLPPRSIDRTKFLCLLEVHLSASSAAITISGRVILSAPVFLLLLLLLFFSFFSSALRITLISLCIVAVNWRCPWRALRCEADRAEPNTNWASFFSPFLLQLTAGFNVRVTQVCAHLISLCLRRCRLAGLMNENYKDALPRRSLCHRFAFNDTRTGYLLT